MADVNNDITGIMGNTDTYSSPFGFKITPTTNTYLVSATVVDGSKGDGSIYLWQDDSTEEHPNDYSATLIGSASINTGTGIANFSSQGILLSTTHNYYICKFNGGSNYTHVFGGGQTFPVVDTHLTYVRPRMANETAAPFYWYTYPAGLYSNIIRITTNLVNPAVAGPANLKTYNTNAKANIKSINTNLIANVKTLNTNA